MPAFDKPNFRDGCLEFRVHDGEVAVYATMEGLERLVRFCAKLADAGRSGRSEHLHLEDFDVLTSTSSRATIAVFPVEREKDVKPSGGD